MYGSDDTCSGMHRSPRKVLTQREQPFEQEAESIFIQMSIRTVRESLDIGTCLARCMIFFNDLSAEVTEVEVGVVTTVDDQGNRMTLSLSPSRTCMCA